MNHSISREEFDELIRIKGEVRGAAFKTQAEFLIKQEGKDGLERVEEELRSLGHPFKLREAGSMEFYPVGLVGIVQLIARRMFGYDEEMMKRMGEFESKVSFIMRLFISHFVSLDRVKSVVPEMWRKYYTVGNLQVVDSDEQKRYAVLRLSDFKIHKVHCQDLVGYFTSVLQMVVKSPVTCEETKCVFDGDDYHEFLFKW